MLCRNVVPSCKWFGIFVCAGCLFSGAVWALFAAIQCTAWHGSVKFPETKNLKFKASNAITRYYFVYLANKFYDSSIFSLNANIHDVSRVFSGAKHFWLDFTCMHKFISFSFCCWCKHNFVFVFLGAKYYHFDDTDWGNQINKEALFYMYCKYMLTHHT